MELVSETMCLITCHRKEKDVLNKMRNQVEGPLTRCLREAVQDNTEMLSCFDLDLAGDFYGPSFLALPTGTAHPTLLQKS